MCCSMREMKTNEIMNKTKPISNYRGKTFGVVINPLIGGEPINWNNLSSKEIEKKLNELNFIDKFKLTVALNSLSIENINKRLTEIEDFEGEFEFGTNSNIPHYQLALKTKTICSKTKVLAALNKSINGFINVDVQHNFENMVNYCTKEVKFISNKYSGRIFKKQWKETFLDKKPRLKEILKNPYPWQKFLKEKILTQTPDDRTVNWIIDPVGNTGKSSFARAYTSRENTDAILMKIDNLDRMELSLIYKVSQYRDENYKDPRILFFDFPRASNYGKVMNATSLMEDIKSGDVETNFGGRHKEIRLPDVHVIVFSNTPPDLSVLSTDRWCLWRLGGENYGNIIWPCSSRARVSKFDKRTNSTKWQTKLVNLTADHVINDKRYSNLNIPIEWWDMEHKTNPNAEYFGTSFQYTKPLITTQQETPNFIRDLVLEFRKGDKEIIDFNTKNIN